MTLLTRSCNERGVPYQRVPEDEVEAENPERQQSLLSLFQVDLNNYGDVEFALGDHMRWSPEQIGLLPYWEFEKHVERLSNKLKKQQEQANKQSSEAPSAGDPQRQASQMMKQAQSSMPKVNPSMFSRKF